MAFANKSVAIVGCGAMGGSIASGIASSAQIEPANIWVTDHNPQKTQALADEFGVRVFPDAQALADARADVVVLAVKPQVAPALIAQIGKSLAKSLVISIAAGINLATLEELLPQATHVVRAMPNLPIAVGSGATALAGGTYASPADLDLATELFGVLGAAQVMREDQLDVEGAVVGCGPAFFALMVDTLTRAGVSRGLPAAACRELVVATMKGVAMQLENSGMHPRAYMERVTSPGGTTAAALREFEPLLSEGSYLSVDAALQKTAELAARQ